MKTKLAIFLCVILTISACKKILNDPPDYSEYNYSGKVISAIDKKPLPDVNVSITYKVWVPGTYLNLWIPYESEYTVDFTSTDAEGRFFLTDDKNDDRATDIKFWHDNYLGLTFRLDDKINENYTIELYPYGLLCLNFTMPFIEGIRVSYSVKSKIPVTYSAFNTKSIYSYNYSFYREGVINEYSQGMHFCLLPGCDYDLTVNYQSHSGNTVVSLNPFDTVYYRIGFNNSTLNFSEMDLASLEMPSVNTLPVSGIGFTGAYSGYEVIATDENSVYIFSRGIVWSRNEHPSLEENEGNYIFSDKVVYHELPLPPLQCGTTYYIRSFIKTINGVIYGNELSFTTNPQIPPLVYDIKRLNLTRNSSDFGAVIGDDPCGALSGSGFCLSEAPNPTLADKILPKNNAGYIFHHLTGLTPGRSYYVRPFATNSAGTTYGEEISFTTPADSISDIDGNVYDIVKIGTQWWMAENIKTRHYNNGEVIPDLKTFGYGEKPDTGICCAPQENTSNIQAYGLHYNWRAAVNSRRICPAGWHIPSKSEWTELINFLGGSSQAYIKMEDAFPYGGSNIIGDFSDSVNSSRFTAKAAGITTYPPEFAHAAFWSSYESGTYGGSLYMHNGQSYFKEANKKFYMSVRCIKDSM